ncbi:hypoxanthine phosphoribosyltransferase [Iodidimonas muriae]|uniref:Hypoxanthine phosphoribosyltransferase n=2 Tax=Iodidimonas TaxID=2066486 RepID=A0A5A7MXK7_9PROT|nr:MULTISPECIES: phosphoribosyltransferase family protein [Iodidimonas]GEQ99595.1 hypoxanthine phosphoribosyltransferase [Iodidimonas gelatinilytica]GER07297.1 hypoxanthine phosphoribosyltransferase [Kordiimonadales bacterium JCM 17843]GGO11070.1 hypoxanthine phosphoribosyltransferase [Iodidimonas muriae]
MQHPDEIGPNAIKTLYSAEEIGARIEVMADAIAEAADGPLLVEVIMNGAVLFAADLVRALSRRGVAVEIDFIALSSYGEGTKSSGNVVLEADARGAIAGRDVLLIDDILETGRTLSFAKGYFAEKGAARVMTGVLLDKSAAREPVIAPDFAGFECPDLFVIGYGMDYAYRFRELPYIGYVEQETGGDGENSSG